MPLPRSGGDLCSVVMCAELYSAERGACAASGGHAEWLPPVMPVYLGPYLVQLFLLKQNTAQDYLFKMPTTATCRLTRPAGAFYIHCRVSFLKENIASFYSRPVVVV